MFLARVLLTFLFNRTVGFYTISNRASEMHSNCKSYTVKIKVYINPKNWVILSVIQMTQILVTIAVWYIGTSNH